MPMAPCCMAASTRSSMRRSCSGVGGTSSEPSTTCLTCAAPTKEATLMAGRAARRRSK